MITAILKYSFAATLILACTRLEEDTRPFQSRIYLGSGTSLDSVSVWITDRKDTTYALLTKASPVLTCPAYSSADLLIAGNLGRLSHSCNGSDIPLADTLTADLSRMTPDKPVFRSIRTVHLQSGANTINITASYSVAKIHIGTIENRLEEGAYYGLPITIDKVFIINGIGRYLLFPGESSSNSFPQKGRWWFCPSGISGASPILMGSGEGLMPEPEISQSEIGAEIQYGSSTDIDTDLYTGPNPTETDIFGTASSTPWEARKTRLVVQCIIDDTVFYYPITIDDIIENHIYTIEKLVISHTGTLHPDQPFELEEQALEVRVAAWDGISLTERI